MSNAHAEELLCSPVLVENVIGILAQLLHVGSDEHLAELDEIAVLLIVNLNDTPGVSTTTDVATIMSLDKLIGTNDGERDLACNFLCLSNSLLVLIFISRRLENLNVVIGNIGKDLTERVSGDSK